MLAEQGVCLPTAMLPVVMVIDSYPLEDVR